MPLSGDAQPHPKEAALKAGRPRRYRRRVAGPKQWAAIRAEKGYQCRLEQLVGCPYGGERHLHHLVHRAQGGDDVADNLVPLCQPHHDYVTRGDSVALRELARRLTDAEYAYIVAKLGENGMQRLFGVDR